MKALDEAHPELLLTANVEIPNNLQSAANTPNATTTQAGTTPLILDDVICMYIAGKIGKRAFGIKHINAILDDVFNTTPISTMTKAD